MPGVSLVDYELVPVKKGQYISGSENLVWAEPSIAQAAELMRHHAAVRQRGARAERRILTPAQAAPACEAAIKSNLALLAAGEIKNC